MTEEQIERRVEKMVDHLDRVFLSGAMSQADYDEEMRSLDEWAREQYQLTFKLAAN